MQQQARLRRLHRRGEAGFAALGRAVRARWHDLRRAVQTPARAALFCAAFIDDLGQEVVANPDVGDDLRVACRRLCSAHVAVQGQQERRLEQALVLRLLRQERSFMLLLIQA